MGVPLADIGVNGVHLDDKIKSTLARVFRIKIHIAGKFRKLAPDRRICMFDLKVKVGMRWVQVPLLPKKPGSVPKQIEKEEKILFCSWRISSFKIEKTPLLAIMFFYYLEKYS